MPVLTASLRSRRLIVQGRVDKKHRMDGPISEQSLAQDLAPLGMGSFWFRIQLENELPRSADTHT